MAERSALDPKNTALIIVDMQNDFCHPDGFFSRIGDRMRTIGLEPKLVQDSVGKMTELLETAREAGVFVVHTRVIRNEDVFHRVQTLHDILPTSYTVYPDPSEDVGLVPGTWGADTHSDLKPIKGEYLLDKRGFSSFYATDLEVVLRRRGIRTVVLAGTVTYVCVLHTAFDAHVRDFDVIVLDDGTASWAPELQQPVMRLVDLILGATMSVGEFLEELRQIATVD